MADHEQSWLAEFLTDQPETAESQSGTPLWGDNDDQRLGPRSRNSVFFREMFGESAELLERVENLRGQFEAFLETRAVFLGTDSQPGLMVTVEEFQGQISAIEELLSELTSVSQSALEMRDLSQNLLVAIPDRLLGTLRSQLFEETLRKVLADGAVEVGHEIAVARLELAASQIAPEAGESAKRVVDAVLAKHDADSVVALDLQITDLNAQHEIEIKRLIGQHQIALERAEAALAEAHKSCERVAKQRDQAEARLQHERRIQGRSSLQWGVVAFASGIGLTLFLHQPALASLSNFVKTL